MENKKERLEIYTLLLHRYKNAEKDSSICMYGLCYALATLRKGNTLLLNDFPELIEQKPDHKQNELIYGKKNKLYPEYWFPLGDREPRIQILTNAIKLLKEKK